ncbi:MAG TPA: hypothetical protein IGS52_16405 [Oscillatoriaceae cyanobacterium M33_DOE_052]|uniref:Uncharacterized protein n=1 Tax=Planktothricoides sp. SpSt-374 TaxID=2282167 RepID=A0A7C3ZV73_9CYAN|nr:hypothetical protein [Oscillatoriaceae cyanobacterium M33_DOE_052]
MKTKLLVRWLSAPGDDEPNIGHQLYQGLINFGRSVLFIGLLLISLLPLTLISLLICGDEEADGDAPEAEAAPRHRSLD